MKWNKTRSVVTIAGVCLMGLMMLMPSIGSAKETEKGAKKKIVLLAGRKSHGYGGHEHYAGCVLLAKALNENVPEVEAVVYKIWPEDACVLEDAATIVIFCDGGRGHLAMPHMKELDVLMKKGIGMACLHYGVEIPKGESGDLLKSWIGGYFETNWSVNPHWKAEYKKFPKHEVSAGLRPFEIDDEWYYHMRFVDDMNGVTPILSAIPPEKTRQRPDGAHSGNPTVRSRVGMHEHLAWTYERPDASRGFGFTGGHWHWNWSNDSFRTVVLNGIVWTAGIDIPEGGVPSKRPTIDDLKVDQDYPQPKNFSWDRIEGIIDGWNKGQ